MEQTRRGRGDDAADVARGRSQEAAGHTASTSAKAGEPPRRVNWLSISRTKSLRTNRDCLDCWGL